MHVCKLGGEYTRIVGGVGIYEIAQPGQSFCLRRYPPKPYGRQKVHTADRGIVNENTPREVSLLVIDRTRSWI